MSDDDLGFFEAAHSLRAIRSYEPDPIPDEVITRILDAGIRAPSPQNCQPWAFVVVRDAGRRARVAELYRRTWNLIKEPVYGDLNAIEDPARRRLLLATDALASAADQAPVFVFAMLDRSRLGLLATPDLGTIIDPASAYGCVWAAVQNMLLAARSIGIGGISTTLTRLCEPEIRDLLGTPEHVETVAMVVLGRPRAPARFGPTTRRPVSECAHSETWGAGGF